jgi:hypothetical protein
MSKTNPLPVTAIPTSQWTTDVDLHLKVLPKIGTTGYKKMFVNIKYMSLKML